MDAIARHVLDVNYGNLALGHEVFRRDGATFVRNGSLARIYDANFIFNVSASTPEEVQHLLQTAQALYAGAERLTIRCDVFTPAAFEACLALEGFETTTALALLLEGALRRPAPPIDVRPASTSPAWDEYRRLKRLDWREHAARLGLSTSSRIADDLATSSRLKSPPMQCLLAFVDGQAVGYCQAWEGLAGYGQVEDLFVDPAFRRQGIATALLHAAVRAARDAGAGPIVIVADPADTPKAMYVEMGWSPVALIRQWGKPQAAVVLPVAFRTAVDAHAPDE